MNVAEWESMIGGKSYLFFYQKTGGKHMLTVSDVEGNEEQKIIKTGLLSLLLGVDEKFDLDGKEARLTVYGEEKTVDIVVDGAYLRSGKAYEKLPAWEVMIFVILCALMPVVTLTIAPVDHYWRSGSTLFIPIIMALFLAELCFYIAKLNSGGSLKSIVRIIYCVIFTLICWAFGFFMLHIGMPY